MPSHRSKRYRVVRSDTFQAAWDAGVADGWLDPAQHEAALDFYANVVLPRAPGAGEPAPDAAANVLVVRFPRSPRSLTFIAILYSIVEDDRVVTLRDVFLLPGADYEG